jgi:hypothetical protein
MCWHLTPIRSKAGLSAFVIPSECEGSLGWVSPESKPRSFGHDTGLRMTNKGKPEVPPSLRSVRDDKHKRLARDDDEGFVILSECEDLGVDPFPIKSKILRASPSE